jgi:hypothetical protein
LRVRDVRGRLPLHAAADQAPRWWGGLVVIVAERCPDALSERDNIGRMPLHIMIDNYAPDDWSGHNAPDVQQALFNDLAHLYPHVLGLRDGRGRLPLHVAMAPASNKPSWDLVVNLLEKRKVSGRCWDGASGLPPVLLAASHGAPIDVLYRLAVEWPEMLEGRREHRLLPDVAEPS